MSMLSSAFDFGDKKLRVYGTPENPWFRGKDVCEILGYKDSVNAIKDHVKSKYINTLGEILKHDPATCLKGNMKNTKLINEQGLYCLIFNSKMKMAEKFREWVFEEVLPSIRKNGSYVSKNISNEQVEELMRQLEEEKQKVTKLEKERLVLNTIVDNLTPMEKNQIFYIATTRSYAAQNRFKFGGVKSIRDIRSRLNTYNTGRAENDLIYICKIFKCYNYKQVESRIGEILSRFRDKQNSQKELLFIRYDRLEKIAEFICDNYNSEIDYINDFCQSIFDEIIKCDPIVPEPLNFEDSMEITATRNGETQVHKIKIEGWSDDQYEKALIDIMNLCVRENNINHNFEAGDVAAEFDWSNVSKNIKNMYNSKNTMNKWRETFKNWYKINNLQQLRVRGIKI